MNAPVSSLQTQWPAPLTAREWDKRFPGILDAVGLVAAGANIIMQLALPPVGYGVAESRVTSGSVFHHPFKRTRTTLTYLAVAMLGNDEEKQAYRMAVNRSHAQVRSTDDSPVKYNAFDPQLQLWVAACLYWGYADLLEKMHGKLSREQAQELYRLAEPLGTTLQVRADMWPATLDEFDAYWQENLKNLQIDDYIRGVLLDIADLNFMPAPIKLIFGRFNRFVTAGFLPAEMREQMHLQWSDAQQRRFQRVLSLVFRVNRFVPRVVRQAPTLLLMRDFRQRLRNSKSMV
ncbi:oxygenase MpaB family protein [Alcanivorax sp. 1008]|uniref:oxygenase MpaB family protein n=1 Tax=Alcanivorax sp. 1008 TaxID=2816853 RepID=UPI001DA50BF0|nr:oxygenase MpaB family protein [Alcanivorax sp. 1008]MCC1495872.1 DUF2236 domain-containing protein [Alcanivorax sp. 1008]